MVIAKGRFGPRVLDLSRVRGRPSSWLDGFMEGITMRFTRTLAAIFASMLFIPLLTTSATAADTFDPLRDKQWGLDQINAGQAWQTSTGAGAVVGVIDSGVDLNHPDLQGQLVPGATFTCGDQPAPCGNGSADGPDGQMQPSDIHGTHVAGIIAASANNGEGIAGVAPDAKVMPIKSLEAGTGGDGEIGAGIRWAVDHGADVLNLSLGSSLAILGVVGEVPIVNTVLFGDKTLNALQYAEDQGVVVVIAAGNSGTINCSYPAFNAGICVGATDKNKQKSTFSELPIKLDQRSVAAPGGDGAGDCRGGVWSSVPVGEGSCGQAEYAPLSGTSMATPHVAGVAALLTSQGRNKDQVEDAILQTAKVPAGLLGSLTLGQFNLFYGHGIVDAAAAVAY